MTRVAIIGAGGYTGIELVKLLARHPRVELVSIHGSQGSVGGAITDRAPELRGVCDLVLQSPAADLDADLVFLATPHDVSAQLAGPLLDADRRVIDLSGAFRFSDPAQVRHVYGFDLPRPELLHERVYGLPEIVAANWESARLVACAGCYVTAAAVPLHAAMLAAVVDPSQTVIVDAISGVSGAGRGANPTTSFCEVSATPYKVLAHRHEPEIAQATGAPILFTPTLGPWKRGILATIHAGLAEGATADDVRASLVDAYHAEPLVRILPQGTWPSVAAVENTNFIDIACAVDEPRRRIILFSTLDNLLKGASGQAVQCMNLMLGLPQETGLIPQSIKQVLA